MKAEKSRKEEEAAGHDAPITTASQDYFAAMRTATSIQRCIATAPSTWSTRIGLHGAWGSGKTSILNLLEVQEKEHGSVIVRISAWPASGESGVLLLFYDALVRELKAHGIDPPKDSLLRRYVGKGKGVVSSLLRIGGKGAEAALKAPEGTADALAGVADVAFGWLAIDRKDIEAVAARLNGRRVVTFIDDLDRADPRVIPKTLLAIRELLDWPGFTFVLAFDRRVVASALREYSSAYGENAERFLEKIIDVPVDVPIPTEEQKLSLATHAFSVCCPFIPEEVLRALKEYLPNEPRRIKLIARKLGVLREVVQRHGSDELDWFAIGLYNVVHESSPSAALQVVESSGGAKTWALISGTDAEKKDAEDRLKGEIRPLITGQDAKDVQRALVAAVRLMNHWSMVDVGQITYLVNLAHSEPPFTSREIESLFATWSPARPEQGLAEAIRRASTLARLPEVEAAVALLTMAGTKYEHTLRAMADAPTEVERSAHAREALVRLSFLEHLFLASEVPAVISARHLPTCVAPIVGTALHWAGWVRNDGEPELRDREKRLAFAAALNTTGKEEIYEGTDPFWESHGFDAPGSPRTELREELRALLRLPITEGILQRFRAVDGLHRAARAEDGLAAWWLESPKSPLYRVPELTSMLTGIFESPHGASDNAILILAENAKTYLRMLVHEARDSSWAGEDAVQQIHSAAPTLIGSAWSAVMRCPVPFRMVASLLRLKKSLASKGVPEDELREPEWLRAAAEELAKIERK